jgi:GT2 family glycosyltransferase
VNDQAKVPLSPKIAFGGRPLSIGVQTVLYYNKPAAIDRSLAAIARAADLAIAAGVCPSVSVFYGDSSASPCLTQDDLQDLSARHGWAVKIEYDFFDGNLGSARGHNRLAEANNADILLIKNPDVVVAPRLFEVMIGEFAKPGTGMVEAKQLPIEHPKDYDIHSGETCWATTACAMIPSPLFRQLDGFDAESFFLYCDDVDFSWRVRLAGFKVIFQPSAVVFHDKLLGDDGNWQPSSAEEYYSAEAALMMTYKWSRPDLTSRYLQEFKHSGVQNLQRAAMEFERRQSSDTLPIPIDPEHRIGLFKLGMYAEHRFPL